MPITHVNTTGYFNTTASANLTPATPVGTTLDDLLLLRVLSIQNAVLPTPSGWTLARADATSGVSPALFYRWATASEPTTQSIVTASGRWAALLSSYRGVDKTTPLDGVAVGFTTGTTTTVAFPAITPATAGAWIVATRFESHASGVTTATYTTSNMTLRTQVASNAASAVNMSIGTADTQWTSGAFTPNLQATAAMSQNRAYVLALRPAAGGGTSPARIRTQRRGRR